MLCVLMVLQKNTFVLSHCLKLGNCYNEDTLAHVQERCANLAVNNNNSN